MAFFPGLPSVPLLCCSFRSKFRRFCRLTGVPHPALHALPLRGHDSRVLPSRCAIRGLYVLDAGDPPALAPAQERARRLPVGGAGVFVADIYSEELDEAPSGAFPCPIYNRWQFHPGRRCDDGQFIHEHLSFPVSGDDGCPRTLPGSILLVKRYYNITSFML